MIRFIDNVEDMRNLAARWNKLEEDFRSPVLSHEWFLAGATALCPP